MAKDNPLIYLSLLPLSKTQCQPMTGCCKIAQLDMMIDKQLAEQVDQLVGKNAKYNKIMRNGYLRKA